MTEPPAPEPEPDPDTGATAAAATSDRPEPEAGSRRGRVHRIACSVAMAVATMAAAPLLAIFGLRWIDPPTSAFMIRYRLAAGFGGGAGDETEARRREQRPTLDYRWTDLEEIAPAAALAVVAAEDQLFPAHHGFDLESISDAIAESGERGRVRGASTLTQQVAKNLFLWPGRSWLRKGLEAYLTVAIELAWPKRRILEVYLNIAEMGAGVYGVQAAAETYFDKDPARLTRREAALIAASLPNPTRRRPDRPSPWLLERAAWIERQIDQLGGAAHLDGILPEG